MAETVCLLLNYERAALSLACLAQVRQHLDPDLPVLLLDNGSQPDERARLQEGTRDQAGVVLRLLHANLGYCAAINQGLDWAADQGARFVLLLNNDLVIGEDFLTPLQDCLRNDAGLAGVMPTVLRGDGKVWSQGATMAFGPNLNRLRGEGGKPAPRSAGPEAVDYLPGACVLYRLEDLRLAGGLDEGYFMYLEDAALGARLRAAGRRLLWLPWVRVGHEASSSSGGGRSPLRKYLAARNAPRYLWQHFSWRLLGAWLLFDLLLLPLVLLRSGPRVFVAKARGTLHGLCLPGRPADAASIAPYLRS